MSSIIKANRFIESHLEKLQKDCDEISKYKKPRMKVFLVGEHAPSLTYVNNKKRMCEKVGAECEIIRLEEKTSQVDFLQIIEDSNNDDSVTGMIIQLPLPQHLKELDIYSLVAAQKDIDGFHPRNINKIFENKVSEDSLIPCTPKGVMNLLRFEGTEFSGKKVAVIGRSHIVGKPLSLLFLNKNATVTMCHSQTKDLRGICQDADIIVSAVGKPKFIDESFVSKTKKQTFVDVGMSKLKTGKLCGDMDFDSILACEPQGITPVPGGVGPMTVFSLIQNLLIATKGQIK